MTPAADLTILIPTWNRRDLLERCLSYLRGTKAQILVVDNGSTDGSAELAEAQGAAVIRLSENRGFAAGVNAGLQQVTTRWVAILNNDVEPEPAYFETLQRAAEEARAWWATGKIMNAAQRSLFDATIDALSRGACPWRVGHNRPEDARWHGPAQALLAPFTALLLRTELFQKLGGLDERFESYLEDVEFSVRAALAGYGGCYVPEARAYHQGSATLGRWHGNTVRRMARNQIWLVARHYPDGWFTRYGWAVLIGQILWVAVSFTHGAGWSACRGKWEGIKTFRTIRQATPPQQNQAARLAALLADSEREIEAAQQATGWDLYWKWYFRLT